MPILSLISITNLADLWLEHMIGLKLNIVLLPCFYIFLKIVSNLRLNQLMISFILPLLLILKFIIFQSFDLQAIYYYIGMGVLLACLSVDAEEMCLNYNSRDNLLAIFLHLFGIIFLAISGGETMYEFSSIGYTLPVGSHLDQLMILNCLIFILISRNPNYLFCSFLILLLSLIFFFNRTQLVITILTGVYLFMKSGYLYSLSLLLLSLIIFNEGFSYLSEDRYLFNKFTLGALVEGRLGLLFQYLSSYVENFNFWLFIFGNTPANYFDQIGSYTIGFNTKKFIEVDFIDIISIYGFFILTYYLYLIAKIRNITKLFLGLTLIFGHWAFNPVCWFLALWLKKVR